MFGVELGELLVELEVKTFLCSDVEVGCDGLGSSYVDDV